MDHEKRRLDVLKSYDLLDTPAEKVFDDLTALAATLCQVPISLVSLVDQHRQWFKSRQGLDATETPRDMAFCHHAIRRDDVMVVEDATNDPRFEDNPLVTGDPNIRFYAGAPLEMESGYRIGTLCVIDQVPRSLDDDQLRALEVLRNAVVAHVELRGARLVTICAWCSNMLRDEHTGRHTDWQSWQKYLADTCSVTHGICPRCLELQRQKLSP